MIRRLFLVLVASIFFSLPIVFAQNPIFDFFKSFLNIGQQCVWQPNLNVACNQGCPNGQRLYNQVCNGKVQQSECRGDKSCIAPLTQTSCEDFGLITCPDNSCKASYEECSSGGGGGRPTCQVSYTGECGAGCDQGYRLTTYSCSDGSSYSECTPDSSCTTVTHNECVGGFCVPVAGPGPSQCTSDPECQPQTHTECVNEACVTVSGPGFDQCYSNVQCRTTPVCGDGVCNLGETCQSCRQDCSYLCPSCGDGFCGAGETPDSCPQDCPRTSPTHLECVNEACVEVYGSGQNKCTTNAECKKAPAKKDWVCCKGRYGNYNLCVAQGQCSSPRDVVISEHTSYGECVKDCPNFIPTTTTTTTPRKYVYQCCEESGKSTCQIEGQCKGQAKGNIYYDYSSCAATCSGDVGKPPPQPPAPPQNKVTCPDGTPALTCGDCKPKAQTCDDFKTCKVKLEDCPGYQKPTTTKPIATCQSKQTCKTNTLIDCNKKDKLDLFVNKEGKPLDFPFTTKESQVVFAPGKTGKIRLISFCFELPIVEIKSGIIEIV